MGSFPAVQVEAGPNGGSLIHLIDLRYADRPGAGFGSVTVAVPVSPTSLAPVAGEPGGFPR